MPDPAATGPLNLPDLLPGGEVEAMVFDGEIVEDEEPGAAVSPAAAPGRPLARSAAVHAAFIAAGAVVLYRRRKQRRGLAHRMAAQLAAQGDADKALLMLRQIDDERHRRHERALGRIGTLVTLARNAHWLALATAGGMLVTGMAVGNPAWAFETAAAAVRDAVTAAVWSWRVGCVALPLAGLAALHEIGRRGGGDLAPSWAVTSSDADADIAIDERAVTQALANLRFPEVREYLKGGHPMQFITPCRTDGRGTYFEVRLPGGLTAERVIKRRPALAASLYRLPKETWPSVGADAGILRGWIADKGALDEGAGPYPLLDEGFADVFKGLPFGRTLRGDPARQPVIGRNSIDGGMPEQGKSNGARLIAAGYTLDLVTELRIYVPDTNFDFEAFGPRCSRYLMGADDEVIERMLEEQELLKEELQRRGQLLVDHGVQEVTYEIAHAGVGLHPVLCLVEEAHVPITHKKYGKDFAQLLGENVKLDRKRAVHIKVSTQAPVRGAMPRDVTTNCTVGIAYALADIYANDAILGPGAYSAGHRATELIPGVDAGTALCKGFASEARSEMVQAYRLNTGQVPQIVARAMKELARLGKPVPGTEKGPLAIVSRDLLDDLAAVIRSPERILVRDALGALRDYAPSWGRYRQMTATSLRADLMAEGVKTVNSSGTHYLDPADLRAALARREACE